MIAIGLDLSGGESIVCAVDEGGQISALPSSKPGRVASVLLPLIRSEPVLAGDKAYSIERGIGNPWPPLAQCSPSGGEIPTLEETKGRLLVATLWDQLSSEASLGNSVWSPPDGLPKLARPSAASCIEHERRAVVTDRVHSSEALECVLAIPSTFSESSQSALLGALPSGSRLIWRSVAVALFHLDQEYGKGPGPESMTVVDIGPNSIERSRLLVRRESVGRQVFHVPVRKPSEIKSWPLPRAFFYANALPRRGHLFDPKQLKRILPDVLDDLGSAADVILCGPGAESFRLAVKEYDHTEAFSVAAEGAVASGAALYAWRIRRKLPTYLDQLPSLDLFTVTTKGDPRWLNLIPPEYEIRGGDEFKNVQARAVFIARGIVRLPLWLKRSGELGFRKLTCELPKIAATDTWTDLFVKASAAGGFASVQISASKAEPEVFGKNQTVELNWLTMERVESPSNRKWPIEIKYGWPGCGKLYSHREILDEFVSVAGNLESDLKSGATFNRFERLKVAAKKTTSPRLIGIRSSGDDGAPISQLLTFGTSCPAEFVSSGADGLPRTSVVSDSLHEQSLKIGELLWKYARRRDLSSNEDDQLTYILGRMSSYAPAAFADSIAKEMCSTSKSNELFAAGRVFRTPQHGASLFTAIEGRRSRKIRLNNSWLRAIVYAAYQNEDILSEVSRERLVVAYTMCLEEVAFSLRNGNTKIVFSNGLRAMALLLRCRRYVPTRDFLTSDTCPQVEKRLLAETKRLIRDASALLLPAQKRSLLHRLESWVDFDSDTDEMPPIAGDDEDD
jgi:hypothetical protein